MSSSAPPSSTHPTHLDPSELGTKDYWDKYYQNDLSNLSSTKNHAEGTPDGDSGPNVAPESDSDSDSPSHNAPIDPEDLPSWFSDHSAPSKILRYLTSSTFPLSPSHWPQSSSGPSILDLGTGNGSLLFLLRTSGPFLTNRMCGIDYSETSVALARRLGQEIGQGCQDIGFETCDIIRDDWRTESWWPKADGDDAGGGWDIVLDKGTFDAVSLSDETVGTPPPSLASAPTPIPTQTRICELYPALATGMVRPGGYLIITSCNWTEDELLSWFLPGEDGGSRAQGRVAEGENARLELFAKIPYNSFRFGGGEGQGVCTLCFRRVE